jgi:hypothetical protein
VHEIKHDGYRLQVRRDSDTVRPFTRRGHDWTSRYPAIAATAAQLRARSFTLDGEALVCGPDGPKPECRRLERFKLPRPVFHVLLPAPGSGAYVQATR